MIRISLFQPSWRRLTHSCTAAWLVPIITAFCCCVFRSLFKDYSRLFFSFFRQLYHQFWIATDKAGLHDLRLNYDFQTVETIKISSHNYVAVSWLNDYPYQLMWLTIKWFQRPYWESDLEWLSIGQIALEIDVAQAWTTINLPQKQILDFLLYKEVLLL